MVFLQLLVCVCTKQSRVIMCTMLRHRCAEASCQLIAIPQLPISCIAQGGTTQLQCRGGSRFCPQCCIGVQGTARVPLDPPLTTVLAEMDFQNSNHDVKCEYMARFYSFRHFMNGWNITSIFRTYQL